MRRRKDAQKARDLALQRMERLFSLAAAAAQELHPERSDRYVQIARQISTRTRVRMPRHLKRLFCKHCGGFLSPSSARVRLHDGVLTSTCLRCEKQTRRPYYAKKGANAR
ncbi:Ribonuclease P protein component 4 [uncultured archaeon]|nr:Ribonuclease P protein component 4 [uncultured archaeon]